MHQKVREPAKTQPVMVLRAVFIPVDVDEKIHQQARLLGISAEELMLRLIAAEVCPLFASG